MALKLLVPPSVEPVLLADVKLALRISSSDEDSLVTSLITAARQRCEFLTGRALLSQQWQLTLDSFDALREIPKPPLISVASVSYLDANGVSQTLVAGTDYIVDPASEPARIRPAAPKVTQWPETQLFTDNVVTVVFTAGYGTTPDAVPVTLKQWIILAIGDMYTNRERSAAQQLQALDFADGLLDSERLWPR